MRRPQRLLGSLALIEQPANCNGAQQMRDNRSHALSHFRVGHGAGGVRSNVEKGRTRYTLFQIDGERVWGMPCQKSGQLYPRIFRGNTILNSVK